LIPNEKKHYSHSTTDNPVDSVMIILLKMSRFFWREPKLQGHSSTESKLKTTELLCESVNVYALLVVVNVMLRIQMTCLSSRVKS